MKNYEINPNLDGIGALRLVERPEPALKAGQVMVRMHAASLNFRDIQILRGTYGVQPMIPLSDGAGEVVAVAPRGHALRWATESRAAFVRC